MTHEVFRERFAGFKSCGGGSGTEDAATLGAKLIYDSRSQGSFRADDREVSIDGFCRRQIVGGSEAGGYFSDSWIAGSCV